MYFKYDTLHNTEGRKGDIGNNIFFSFITYRKL